MAVDSIFRVPTVQVHQGADTQDERERLRRLKKNEKQKGNSSSQSDSDQSDEQTQTSTVEIGQILDSTKTIQLLQVKALEPKTLRKHAFLEMTHTGSVNKSTVKRPSKLNKSA